MTAQAKGILALVLGILIVVGLLFVRHHLIHEGQAKLEQKVTVQSAKVAAQVQTQQDKATKDAGQIVENGEKQGAQEQAKTVTVTRYLNRIIYAQPNPAQCIVQPDVRSKLQSQVDTVNGIQP